jgi:simple sugar transport system permease protein
MRHPVGVGAYAGILMVLGLGLLIGFVNGPLVVGLRLNAFIAMLAGLILLPGVTLGFTNGQAPFDLQMGGG